jgi:hypothetical protein
MGNRHRAETSEAVVTSTLHPPRRRYGWADGIGAAAVLECPEEATRGICRAISQVLLHMDGYRVNQESAVRTLRFSWSCSVGECIVPCAEDEYDARDRGSNRKFRIRKWSMQKQEARQKISPPRRISPYNRIWLCLTQYRSQGSTVAAHVVDHPLPIITSQVDNSQTLRTQLNKRLKSA